MEMKANVTVRGFKTWVGAMEGKALDTGKVYVDVELKGETAAGTCTQEIKCSDSKVIDAIKHNKPPFLAELSIDLMSNGKDTTQVCTGIKPLERVVEQGQKKAA